MNNPCVHTLDEIIPARGRQVDLEGEGLIHVLPSASRPSKRAFLCDRWRVPCAVVFFSTAVCFLHNGSNDFVPVRTGTAVLYDIQYVQQRLDTYVCVCMNTVSCDVTAV